jgi:hypothetical protein
MGELAIRCKAKSKQSGEQCKNRPMKGGELCKFHGGKIPKVMAKAAINLEVRHWGLEDVHEDPGEVLLRLVAQSAARCRAYAAELESLVKESPNLREALIAEIWISPDHGDAYKAGEYVRGLAKLEAEERDRLASFCTKAIAAGLAERQVRIAEQTGEQFAKGIKAILDKLGLTEAQAAMVPRVIEATVLELSAG